MARMSVGVGLLTLFGAACADTAESPPQWAGTVTDSAGVSIVQNRGAPSGPGLWAVEPMLSIGPDESRPETLFGHVVDVTADPDGRVFVVDRMAQEVRVFGPEGTHLGAIGGPGQGPGEFSTFVQSALLVDDTLVAVDLVRRNLQRFLTDGTFIDAEPLPGSGRVRSWWTRSGGSYWYRSLERLIGEDGAWGGFDQVVRLSRDGAVADTVVVMEYTMADLGAPGSPKLPYLVNTPAWTPLPDGRVAWTHLESDRVFVHGGDGALQTIIENEGWVRRSVGATESAFMADLLREKMGMLGGSPDAVDQVENIVPAQLPAITALVAGPDSTLWVQRMGPVEAIHPMALNAVDPPTGWGGTTWDVLDSRGRLVQTLELPERFRILRFVGDRMYGVQRTELDEEVVRAFRLVSG